MPLNFMPLNWFLYSARRNECHCSSYTSEVFLGYAINLKSLLSGE